MAVEKDPFFSELARTALDEDSKDTFRSEQVSAGAELTDPIQIFKQGVVSGGYNLAANLEYFKGIGNSIVEDQDALEKNLYAAEKLEQQAGMAMADVQQFDDFLENPTALGFINQVSSATGQFAPSAIASVASAVSGAGAGVAVVGLTGVTKGLVQNVAKKEIQKAYKKKMKKQPLTKDEEDLLAGAYDSYKKLRFGPAARGGAVAGAVAQEYPQGAGIAFGNFAEEDMTDPIQAFQSLGIGVPFAAVGVGAEALVFKGLTGILKKQGSGPVHKRILGAIGQSAGRTGAVEGITEGIQEELSVQQKFAIDDDYTQAQARLDRAQAVFAGFFGGVGIGAAGGTVAGTLNAATGNKIVDQARENLTAGYREEQYNQFLKERYGVDPEAGMGEVATEPKTWIKAQIEAMLDPNTGKDSVFIDRASIGIFNEVRRENPELDAKLRELPNHAAGLEVVEARDEEGNIRDNVRTAGLLFSTDGAKVNKFKEVTDEFLYDGTKQDEVLVDILGYEHGRLPDADRVVEVRDAANNVVWYQSTTLEKEADVKAKAKELFPESNIVSTDIDDHLSRRNQAPQARGSGPFELDDEGEVVQDDGITEEEEQEALAAFQFETPGVSEEPGIRSANQNARLAVEGIQKGEGWSRGASRDTQLQTDAASYFPAFPQYADRMNSELNRGFYSDALLRTYLRVSESAPNNIYVIQAIDPEADNVRYEIKRLNTTDGQVDIGLGIPTAVTEAIETEKDRVFKGGKPTGWKIQPPGINPQTNQPYKMVPVYMPALTILGRRINTRLGLASPESTELQGALEGFNTIFVELGKQKYKLDYPGKEGVGPNKTPLPFERSNATVYRSRGRDYSYKQLQPGDRSVTPEARRGDVGGTDQTQNIRNLRNLITQTGLVEQLGIQEQFNELNTLEELENFVTEEINPNIPDPQQRIMTSTMFEGAEFSELVSGRERTDVEFQEEQIYVDENDPRAVEPNTIILTDALRQQGFEPGDVAREAGTRQTRRVEDSTDFAPLTPEQQANEEYKAATFDELGSTTRRTDPGKFVDVFPSLAQRLGDPQFVSKLSFIAKDRFKLKKRTSIFTSDVNFDEVLPLTKSTLPNINYIKAQQNILNDSTDRARFISLGKENIILVKIGANAGSAEQGAAMISIAHEFGHAVFDQEVTNTLETEIGKKVYAAFEAERDAPNAPEMYQEGNPHAYEEWYADKVGGFLLAELRNEKVKAKNGVESYFKRIAKQIADAFRSLSSEISKRFSVNPDFTDYAQNVVRVYKDGFVDFTRNKGSYQQRRYSRAMVDNFVPKTFESAGQRTLFRSLKKAAIDILEDPSTMAPLYLKKVFYPADNFLKALGKGVKTEQKSGIDLDGLEGQAFSLMEDGPVTISNIQQKFKVGFNPTVDALNRLVDKGLIKETPSERQGISKFERTEQGKAKQKIEDIGKALAAMFYTSSQSEGGTGLLTANIVKANAEVNKLSAILELDDVSQITPEAEAILLEAENDTIPTEQLGEKAKQVREWLSDFYDRENLGAIFNNKKIENYFPRMIAIAEITENVALQDSLVNLIVQNNPNTTEQVAREVVQGLIAEPANALIEGNETDGEGRFNIGLAKERAALFKTISTKDLRDAQLLEEPAVAVRKYLANSIKRSEFNKRGGAKRVQELVDQLPENEQGHAVDAIDAIMGRVNPNMGANFRFINSWGLVANITTLLAFAVFASLPDFAGPILRSKEFSAFGNFGRELGSYFQNSEEASRFAKDIGVVSTDAINTMYINAGELDFMSKNAKNVSEKFFKYTGLEWYTRFTRIFAAGMGRRFLMEHQMRADQGDVRSQRYLRELGVTSAQIKTWNNSQNVEAHPEVKLALAQFVDESIVRPNAAERPVWASDPRLALVWQLKSFFYAYGKNIVGGVMRESSSRVKEGAGMNSATLPLLLAASTLLPLSMLGLDLRERFKVGLAWALPGVSPEDKNYRKSLDMEWDKYSFEIIDRSGVLGPWALAAPLFMESKRYGDPFWVSPLGPSVEKGYDLLTGDLDFGDITPIYNQIGGFD